MAVGQTRTPAMMRSGDIAWIALGAGVAVYELAAAARRVEFLSHAVDRYRAARPVPTVAAILYLAAHLTRAIPRKLDPLTLLTENRRTTL